MRDVSAASTSDLSHVPTAFFRIATGVHALPDQSRDAAERLSDLLHGR
jgi:hypothetical protein